MLKEEIFKYVKKLYGTEPEHLWECYPEDAVLRHSRNKKWYAVIMSISKEKLGLQGNDIVDIMNVKCDPDMVATVIQSEGFFPGYHMNKANWITIILDGTVSEEKVLDFLDMSFDIIDHK